MEPIRGSCLCGAIQYRSEAEPSKIHASDCRHCQKQSGTAISISVGVPGETLRVKGLRPTVYEDTRDSGAVILRSFCPNCGTPLFSESGDEPDLVFIKTATLDDPLVIDPKDTRPSSKEISGRPAKTTRSSSHIIDLFARHKRLKVS